MTSIIFFDGVCGLCNHSVLFVLKRDRNNRFLYSPQQSPYAQEILPKYGGNPQNLNTIYVLKDAESEQPTLLKKSTAACYILSELGGGWRLLSYGRFLPQFLRDFAYDCVAKTRYRFFGKKEVCMLPEAGWTEKFLEEAP
ncbi:MAG: thiol-disulfide oxidoreductase [Deltaproteobacteria bacterium]|nr:thiol-disulfide oxidoreductase [Deltaproteobacteria bacterium]